MVMWERPGGATNPFPCNPLNEGLAGLTRGAEPSRFKAPMKTAPCFLRPLAFLGVALAVHGQDDLPGAEYHIYRGNTHSHTMYTWSHGEQWMPPLQKTKQVEPAKNLQLQWVDGDGSTRMYVKNSTSYPGPKLVLKDKWQQFQGPPSVHFEIARANGYDFYVTTDHSQEQVFQPPKPDNVAWVDTGEAAEGLTTDHFVAIRGYEHSENDGPDGKGHLNVINSAEYLNALSPGVGLQTLYTWLKTAKPNGDGPVVVSFNHPGPHQYNDWAYRDPAITEIISMLEVINSNTHIHYEGWINALDKGWKVSPCCGNDNHGLSGITRHKSRTFVLASSLTKAALLDGMRHRRTYASLDKDIQCRYSVNGRIMGSTLDGPGTFKFDIVVSDPDTNDPKDKITRIDIVKDHGVEVQSFTPKPGYTVRWQPTIEDATSHYFFVRVWNAGGGDAPNGDPAKPVAWLAPVWTGRS
jgi:hypothetical protein